MSRSLAFVGILSIIGTAGIGSAVGQTDANQTSEGVVVQNHMSDSERDRLMKEAMEKARRQLEQKKAQEQAAIEKAADEQNLRDSADEKAEAAKKAEEERLASELAEEEKARISAYESMELEPLKPSEPAKKDLDKEPAVKDTEKKAVVKQAAPEAESKSEKAKSVAKSEEKSSEKSVKQSEKKVTASAKSDDSKKVSSKETITDLDKAKDVEETAIETVSTNLPGKGLSVKTNMPLGDQDRKAEQQAALARDGGYDAPSAQNGSRSSGGSVSLSGRVVGMMRSSNDSPRILVQSDDRRMVQVVLENGADMPAPGSTVSIRGRDIGGAAGRQVVSAESVSIKSGQAMKAPSTVAAAPAPAPIAPAPALMPPPPMGMIGPPMPFGPMPMVPPPPPF